MKFWIVESINRENTWFLFRENGKEIRITKAKNLEYRGDNWGFHITSSMELKKEEYEYFIQHYADRKNHTIRYEL